MNLTNKIRDSIITAVLEESPLAKEKAALAERAFDFAEQVYDDLFGDIKEQMYSLPEGWLFEKEYICVEFSNTSCGSKGFCQNFSLRQPMRMPYAFAFLLKTYTEKDPMWHVREALAKDAEDVNARFDAAYSQTKEALYSVYTTKQLIQTWPEVESIVNKVLGATATSTNT